MIVNFVIMNNKKIKILDIGHSNLTLETAMNALETTVSQDMYEGKVRAVKVITGHGTGQLRKAVRNWCKEQKGRFLCVIYGEHYNLFNRDASDMRFECDISNDPDYGRNNKGITYIWLH